MLSKQDVEHIAKLARIALDEKDVEKFQKELGSILEYFATLSEAGVETARATTHSGELEHVLRDDEPSAGPREKGRDLIAMVPEETGGYVKVKSVLEHGETS